MFFIRREGEFIAYLTPGTPHCGTVAPVNNFRYFVEICGSDSILDREGFLLDNAILDEYWKDTYNEVWPSSASCELMAKQAAQDFYEMLGRRKKHCVHVCVKIWGIPTSHIEYRLEPKRKASRQ